MTIRFEERPRVYIVSLFIFALLTIVAGIYLLLPVRKPQVQEIRGTIDEIYVDSGLLLTKYTPVRIRINGKLYTTHNGSSVAIDKSKIKEVERGSSVIALCEEGIIRSLTINGEVNFTIEDYLREEHIYRLLPAGFCFLLSSIAIVTNVFCIRKRSKEKKSLQYKFRRL